MNDKLKKYGKSKDGNFYVIDTIGVPHPYCITTGHVAEASDHFCGRLGTEAIEAAEEKGATCGICKGKLTYKEHQQALLVSCKCEANGNKELHEFLLSVKDMAVKDGYAGFAFKKDY